MKNNSRYYRFLAVATLWGGCGPVVEENNKSEAQTYSWSEYVCPQGFVIEQAGQGLICGNNKEMFGPFTEQMILKCLEDGNTPQVCEANTWDKKYALWLRGEEKCPKGSQWKSDLNACFEKKSVFGPFTKTQVKKCEELGGGDVCYTNRWHYSFMEDSSSSSSESDVKKVTENADIRILMYHDIPESIHKITSQDDVALSHFKEQLDTLIQKGYFTISLEEFTKYHKNKLPIPQKSVLITFDDGYIGNYTNALPALKARNMKAVFFVHTAYVGVPTSKDHMTWEMLKNVDNDSLFEVESHTVSHPKLGEISSNDILKELQVSKEKLELNLNKKVRGIAYPYGSYNAEVIRIAKQLGYEVGIAVGKGPVGDKMFTFTRYGIGKDINTKEKFLSRIKL